MPNKPGMQESQGLKNTDSYLSLTSLRVCLILVGCFGKFSWTGSMDRVHGVVHGGPWTPVHVLYTS